MPVNFGTCHLLGHSFGRSTANVSILMKFRTLHKVRVANSIVTIVFCDSRRLSNLTPVNISTCHLLSHSYGGWCDNSFEPELQEVQLWWNLILYTNRRPWIQWRQFFLWFLTLVNIDTCHLLGHSFRPKTANLPILMKFYSLHKSKVVNLMVSILRDASGCRRELKLGIEKQILCQKYYCFIINKTGKNYSLLP